MTNEYSLVDLKAEARGHRRRLRLGRHPLPLQKHDKNTNIVIPHQRKEKFPSL
jgi:hypothetical protein